MNTLSIHHRKCIYIHTVSVYRLFITTFSQYFLLLTRITGATSWRDSSDKVASVSLRSLKVQLNIYKCDTSTNSFSGVLSKSCEESSELEVNLLGLRSKVIFTEKPIFRPTLIFSVYSSAP